MKRKVIRILSFLVALLIIAAIIIINSCAELKFYKTQVLYTRMRAAEELEMCLNNININLEKAAYITTSKQMNSIATEIYTEAKIAKQAFLQLPAGEQTYENFNKFLSQVGNYSIYLAKKIITGGEIENDEREKIQILGKISANIAKGIEQIEIGGNDAEIRINELLTNTVNNEDFSVDFVALEEGLTDYPALIYDGPYSDNILNGKAELIENGRTISESDAKTIGAKMLGISADLLTLEAASSGKIPTYDFVYGAGAVSVSQKGGYIVYFRKYTQLDDRNITPSAAVTKAQKFINKSNSENFIPTYNFTDNGVCVVNFAAKNGNTICYTDLVKVGVDLSNGEIVFYEGRGYLINHKNRTIKTPENTVESAKGVLSPSLTLKSYALALIPTDWGEEILCYEFACAGKENEDILVYINTETLEEESVFLLLNTNEGTLVK